MPTFTFSIEVDYQNNIGRDCVTACDGTYSSDADGQIEIITLSHNGSEYDDSLIEDEVFAALEDQAMDDYSEWESEQAEELAV